MKHGFTKVAAAIPGVRVADCNYNITQIQALMLKASEAGAQLVAFPELSVTAYTCMDLFSGKLLLDQAEKALVELVHSTRDLPVLAVVGMPLRTENRLINAAVVFQQGKILGVVPKTYLPNYKEFQEQRWFSSASDLKLDTIRIGNASYPMGGNLLFETGNLTVGIELCEDLLGFSHVGSQCYREPLCQQRTDREEQLPEKSYLSAVGPLHQRICLRIRGVRRVYDRPGICR